MAVFLSLSVQREREGARKKGCLVWGTIVLTQRQALAPDSIPLDSLHSLQRENAFSVTEKTFGLDFLPNCPSLREEYEE